MILQHLNYLAVAVSAVAYFLIGAVWFSPIVIGTAWMKGHGISEPTAEEKKGMGKMMAMTFVYCLIATIVLACVVYKVDARDWMTGAKTGLAAGVFA